MTAAEKLALLKQLTTTPADLSVSDAVCTAFIETAGQAILNKLYPFPNVDDDRIVEETEMVNDSYTISAQPDFPRNLTVTVNSEDSADTMGILTVSYRDVDGTTQSGTLTPVADQTAFGTFVCSHIYSITGSGWEIDGTNDTIKIGVGDTFDVPIKYHYLQCQIAAYLLNKQGAEGESRHSENGVDRTYESADIPSSMLSSVVPYVGVL